MMLGVMPFVRRGMSDPRWVADFSIAVEATRAESIWTYEHVALPHEYRSPYPFDPSGRMSEEQLDEDRPDPLHWLHQVASHTERVRLGTGVMILPLHNPLILAKRLATLDHFSGGRLIAGFGIGWLAEEYEALGVPFRGRGKRADEYLQVMRTAWAPGTGTFSGTHHSFTDLHVNPKPVRPGGVPIVIGGNSAAAMRRAARYGDGIFVLEKDLDLLRGLLAVLRDEVARSGRRIEDLEITADAPRDAATADVYRALGIDRVVLALPADSLEEMQTEIDAYGDEVLER